MNGGGLLVSFGVAANTSLFLNGLFGFATSAGGAPLVDPSSLTGTVLGTIYDEAPAQLPANNETGALLNLPPGPDQFPGRAEGG